MNIHHLVTMANQIAAFFHGSGAEDEAAKSTAQHLKNFWEPRMRREIIAYVKQSGGGDLSEIAREAVAILETEEKERVAR